LQPEIGIKVFPIPFTDAVADPRTMMVISADALFAHAAMSGPQRHINEALSAVPQANFYLACAVTTLNCRQILLFAARLDLPGVLNRHNVIFHLTIEWKILASKF
jgi:hypothetical protein